MSTSSALSAGQRSEVGLWTARRQGSLVHGPTKEAVKNHVSYNDQTMLYVHLHLNGNMQIVISQELLQPWRKCANDPLTSSSLARLLPLCDKPEISSCPARSKLDPSSPHCPSAFLPRCSAGLHVLKVGIPKQSRTPGRALRRLALDSVFGLQLFKEPGDV